MNRSAESTNALEVRQFPLPPAIEWRASKNEPIQVFGAGRLVELLPDIGRVDPYGCE